MRDGSAEREFDEVRGRFVEQLEEPQWLSAGRVDDEVEGVHLIRPELVAQRQRDAVAVGDHPDDPSLQMGDPLVAQQGLLHPDGEHATVGAAYHISAFGQAQAAPLDGVAVQRVLEVALAAGVDGGARRDHRDGQHVVPHQFVECRSGCLATADHRRP